MLVAKRWVVSVILLTCSLIFSSASYAGVHFVELPESVTDEMMLNQTPELKSQLLELINEAVKGSVDEIKTIIFTRYGEPWYKNIDPALIGNLTAATESAITKAEVDNNLTFYLTSKPGTDLWTTPQREDMDNFLYHAVGDDNLEHGIYDISEKLYGQPFFSYTISTYLDSDMEDSAYWIPPYVMYHGYEFYGPYGGELYLKNWRNGSSDPKIPDNDRAVLAKAMLELFWGPFDFFYDQFHGMSESGGTTIMSFFSNAYPNYVEIYHGERPDFNEYRPGFIFYDNYNNHAISTGGYNFADGNHSAELARIRYQMANMAWFKAYTAGVDQGFQFYQEFNKVLYDYGLSFQIPDQGSYDLYQEPSFQELAKLAEGGWDHGLQGRDGPEGYDSFNAWREEQYILTQQRLIPQFGVFSDHNKLRCQIYFPMIDGEGNYIEEPPHDIITVNVNIKKPNGDVLYSGPQYAKPDNNGYFQVDIPQLPTLTRIDCSCEITGLAAQYFEEPAKKTYVINTRAGGSTNNQVMGVLPSIPGNWIIEDPNGNKTPLDVHNFAFIFAVPGYLQGLEGEYKVFYAYELEDGFPGDEKTFVKDKKSFMTNSNWTPGFDYGDHNGNGVADIYEQELAEKFRPIMNFSQLNYFRPFPVEVNLDFCELKYYGLDGTAHLFSRNQDETWQSYFQRAYDWNNGWLGGIHNIESWTSSWPGCENIDDWEGFYHEHNNFDRARTTIYYNFFLHDGLPVIQYWFYYPYNDFTFDDHEGDWETILVRFSSECPELGEALDLDYKYHGRHCYVSGPDDDYWVNVFPTYHYDWPANQHPFVYVGGFPTTTIPNEAQEGNYGRSTDELSGASFPRPTPYGDDDGWIALDGLVFTVKDKVRFPHTVVDFDTEVDLVQILFEKGNDDPEKSNYLWLSFPGKWGDTGGEYTSPVGPVFSEESQSFLDDAMAVLNDEPNAQDKIASNEEDKESKSLEKSSKGRLPLPDSNKTIDLSELKPDVGYPFDGNSERQTIESGTSPKTKGLDVDSPTTNLPFQPTNLTSHSVILTQNPATTQTTIKLNNSLTDGNPATISIYDISGRLIKKVETDSDYTWDLVSDSGGKVSSGIYIICVQTTSQEILEKLAVVR